MALLRAPAAPAWQCRRWEGRALLHVAASAVLQPRGGRCRAAIAGLPSLHAQSLRMQDGAGPGSSLVSLLWLQPFHHWHSFVGHRDQNSWSARAPAGIPWLSRSPEQMLSHRLTELQAALMGRSACSPARPRDPQLQPWALQEKSSKPLLRCRDLGSALHVGTEDAARLCPTEPLQPCTPGHKAGIVEPQPSLCPCSQCWGSLLGPSFLQTQQGTSDAGLLHLGPGVQAPTWQSDCPQHRDVTWGPCSPSLEGPAFREAVLPEGGSGELHAARRRWAGSRGQRLLEPELPQP